MFYAIMGEDVENSLEIRLKNRPAHLDRLSMLMNEGRLLIAGPHPSIDGDSSSPAEFSGSLIIAKFASLDEATDWANNDPYVIAGVFQKTTIKPFIPVLP